MLTQKPPRPTPSAAPAPASWIMADGLMKEASRKLKRKDFRAASRDANDAYRVFQAAVGVPEAKVKELTKLRRTANLSLADTYLEAAEKALEGKDWDQAATQADDAGLLYQEFKGSPQKRKRAATISESARRLRRETQGT